MIVTTSRTVGGSVLRAVPPAVLDLLDLRAGAPVGVAVEDGRLVVSATAFNGVTRVPKAVMDDVPAKIAAIFA